MVSGGGGAMPDRRDGSDDVFVAPSPVAERSAPEEGRDLRGMDVFMYFIHQYPPSHPFYLIDRSYGWRVVDRIVLYFSRSPERGVKGILLC